MYGNDRGFQLTWTAISPPTSNITTGTVTSPHYPDNYPDNVDVTTVITGPEGTNIRITFDDFQLEDNCDNNWVKVSFFL